MEHKLLIVVVLGMFLISFASATIFDVINDNKYPTQGTKEKPQTERVSISYGEGLKNYDTIVSNDKENIISFHNGIRTYCIVCCKVYRFISTC